MENQSVLTKKLNNTSVFAETSNKMIGQHYYHLLNLHTMPNHIEVHKNPLLKSGMGSTQPLNHHYNYKPDYKVWMNMSNTWNKSAKR